MSYTLTIGSLHVLTGDPFQVDEEYDCHGAREACMPSFVFSVEGQVGFRAALEHLATCNKQDCRTLRARVLDAMKIKLDWLLKEQSLLGCIHVQPALYGSRRIILRRSEFPILARHLARCPKESCAQLRRAVMLNIRDELRPN